MTGMPTNAIVLATGRGAGDSWEIRSATRLIAAPVSIAEGRMIWWAEEPVVARAICGATIPTNPIGPQNAVTAAVIRQQLKSDRSLIIPVSAPDICAYSSPNNIMSNPLRVL